MQHEVFKGRDMREAMAKVRSSLGDEAMILFSRSVKSDEGVTAEIAAAPAAAVDSFRIALSWGSPDLHGPDLTRVVGRELHRLRFLDGFLQRQIGIPVERRTRP